MTPHPSRASTSLYHRNCTNSIQQYSTRKNHHSRRHRKNCALAPDGAGQPENRPFFVQKVTDIHKGRSRQLKSCVGRLCITKKQASRLGVPPYKRLSPLLETCCLLLSANESYQNAEADIETLTGVKVGHSTQHRRVQTHEWSFPEAKQPIAEVSIDGGKVRLPGMKGQQVIGEIIKLCAWHFLYYGGFFQDNQSLIDWIGITYGKISTR